MEGLEELGGCKLDWTPSPLGRSRCVSGTVVVVEGARDGWAPDDGPPGLLATATAVGRAAERRRLYPGLKRS